MEQTISPFLTMFSTLYGTIFNFKCTLKRLQFVSTWTSLILSSGNGITVKVSGIACSRTKVL